MIMKKIALILVALVALACTEKEQPKPKDSIEIKSSKNISFEVAGGKQILSFSASVDWTATPSANWLDVSFARGKSNEGSLELTVSKNTGYNVRKGYVAFAAGTAADTVYVTQAAADYLSVEPAEFRVGNAGGVYFSKLKTNLDYSVKVEDAAASWIKVSGAGVKALADVTLSITVDPLDDVHGREGKIIATAGNKSAEINITQSGQAPVFTATVADRRSPVGGETFSVPVSTNLELSVSKPDWISATRTAAGYDFTVSANTGDNLRTGRVTISNSEFSKSASFSVSQKSPKSLYILAIGNSFSVDAMQYLYQILQGLGYKDIFLGNLYIGGCTLATHANNISTNAGAYEYYTNGSGNWGSVNGHTVIAAMKEREWDFVSTQQASGSSGMEDTFDPYLSTIVAAMKQYCPNAKRMWHMTWAYQGNSTHPEFPKYGKNQMTMYNAIVNAVKNKVVSRGDFDFVIPCGTAVQNVRTSFLGDNITRDGYHMNYKVGRYLTGLMWARQITGKSIADVTYKPASYSYTDDEIFVIKEAVENAFKKPYEVTESTMPPAPPTYIYPTDELKGIFTGAGYSLESYEAVPLIITHNAFYYSNSDNLSNQVTTGSNVTQFAATQIFQKSEIPNGSVVVLKQGYQYRPEGWIALTEKNTSATRPGNVKASSDNSIVVVDDSWWGSWNYRAFNLAKDGNPTLSEAEQATLEGCFAIFKPKN